MIQTHPITGPQVVELIIPQNTCGPSPFGLESTNAQGGRLTDAISPYQASGWFTAHLHRKTTGRAVQPSDRGTHEVSEQGKSKQRAGGRSCKAGRALVNPVPKRTNLARDFKRLISYPTRFSSPRTQYGKGCRRVSKAMRIMRTRKQRSRRYERGYNAYMQSVEWKEFRNKVLELRGMQCEACGSFEGHREIHHLTYVRFRHELPEDVLILCHRCHAKRHPERKGPR